MDKNRLNILFTHGYFLREDLKELRIMKPYVPLGILYVSSYLEKFGFQNEVFDSTFSTFEILKNHLNKTVPDVIAIYTNLMTKINVLKIIKYIKSEPLLHGTKIILGGPEVRNHAKNFLTSGADFIVLGEGEQTTLELVTAISESKTAEALTFKLSVIKGIAYIENADIVITNERPLIKDINSLPYPNRSKINFEPYLNGWKLNHGYSMMSMSTMRGCPYTCKWCSRAVYGGTYRRRSPSLVVEEMKFIKSNYNPDMIWFVDDVFTIHHKWLEEFKNEVKKQNALIPYEIISRADRLNENIIKSLKESGCFRIWIGAESGSQKIIDAMDRRVDVIKTREMINLTKDYGIEAGTFIMLGYPGETKKDIQETIEHLVKSNPSQFTITVAYPIKGTELYNEVSHDILTQNIDWETSTDRDLDFKRTYPKQYYQYAVKWVMNEVYLKTKKPHLFKIPFLKSKSITYQIQMEITKWRKFISLY